MDLEALRGEEQRTGRASTDQGGKPENSWEADQVTRTVRVLVIGN